MPRRLFRKRDWWQGRFNAEGFRITLPRQAILNYLSTNKGHPSAEDIYIAVHSQFPRIGLATVYRTLELLVQMGFVAKLSFGEGKARYELAVNSRKDAQHYHLICVNCRQVIDCASSVEKQEEIFSKIEKELAKKFNFKINSRRIQFLGLCSRCQKIAAQSK